jgi:hypothetical protein
MKSKTSLLRAIIAIACAAVFVTGCVTPMATQSTNQSWGAFGEVLVPVKDFESKGLIFTEVQFTLKTDSGTIDGKVFTYQALLKEAQKVGADAIVNVTIDRMTENVTTGTAFSAGTFKETWYGSALAIKYTGALTQSQIIVSPAREHSIGGSAAASTEQPAGGNTFGFK